MPVIIPRWEWRSFGEHFGEVETVFAAMAPTQVVESEELYLLSSADADVVKVRHELMDIKHLEHVSDDGLELWTPVMKAAFPLAAADVGAALLALRVAAPAQLARTSYSLAELVDEVVRSMGKAIRPERVLFARELPKTRSAKIMRRVVRAAYLGRDPGDLSSLDNPGGVQAITDAS